MHARALSFLPAPLALAMAVLSAPASAQLLPADRATTWNPGVVGGIPVRTTICATVNASTYGNGANEASAGIQTAINNCPAGQVVLLSAGTFRMNNNVVINKGITLRGAGPNLTTLQKTNGATPGSDTAPEYEPIVILGPNRYPKPDENSDVNLTADAVKGTFSVTVTNGAGFAPGQFAILDEDNYNTGAFVALPDRNNQPTSVRIWATDRVVWQRHSPSAPEDDPFPDSLSWFSRTARPVNELKEITAVNGNTITFNTPIHITYRTSHAAQLTRYAVADRQVKFAGLEDLKLIGGSDGQVRFESAAYSWARNIENTVWLGEGVAINHSFRCELRDSYIHDGAWPAPGGGGYAISIADESAEILIENNIIMKANKMMVARSAGTASVVGYNYAQDGFINYNLDWQEVGINGSHMVGPHHILFEGNESFNYDSDNTHGSAIYHTVFRNHLTGRRLTFNGLGNARTMGLLYGSYWHSFVGNVLGNAGQTSGWMYNDPGNAGSDPWSSTPAIYRLGYDPIHFEQKVDPKVVQTTIRDGNFNYLTNQVNWDNTPQTLPNSLYLTQKPLFFGTWTWPWVDPIGGTKLYVLPAKARFEGQSAPPPEASIGDVAIVEGTGNNTVAQFPVTLSAATSQTVTLSYTTVALTATAGSDFVATSGVVTFPPGQALRTIPVTVMGDGVDEADEAFRVDLSAPQQAVLADSQATATIDDDDGPTISAATVVTGEGNAGTSPATFDLTLSAPSPQSVVLSYATSDGTATAGSDYVATSGTVTFPPGTTSVPVTVQINGDALDEPNEAFDLDLSGAVDGRLGTDAVIGRIMDDDGGEIGLAELQHGMTLYRSLESVGGQAGRDLFIVRQPARSSWEVIVDEASGDLGAGQGPLVERVGNDLTTVLQTSLRVGTGPARTVSWQNATSTTAIGYVRVRSGSCTSDCGPDDSYRVRVYETTGRIPRFNMFGGQSTVVILQNTTSRVISGTVNFWNPAGVRLAGQTFTLNPRASTTIFGIQIPAIANQSGAVTVTHDGPYGGLVGKTVTLDAAGGYSFDSSMLPVMR